MSDLKSIPDGLQIAEILLLIDNCQSAMEDLIASKVLDDLTLKQLVGLAAGRRSSELRRTFRFNVEHDLWLVAPAITRLQLDSALRLHALQLVDDGDKLARFILEGNELRKFDLNSESPIFAGTITGSNRQLNDSFLYQKLSEVYSPNFRAMTEEDTSLLRGHSQPERFLENPIGDIYQDGNKFVHLSQSHIMDLFAPESLRDDQTPVLRSAESKQDEEILSSWCVTMLFVTDVLHQQIEGLFFMPTDR